MTPDQAEAVVEALDAYLSAADAAAIVVDGSRDPLELADHVAEKRKALIQALVGA